MAPTVSNPIPILVSSDDDVSGEKVSVVGSTVDGSDGDESKPKMRARRPQRRRSAGIDGRNPAHEVWLFNEEVTMLTVMAEHRRKTGEVPMALTILRALQADPEVRLRWTRRKPMCSRAVGKKKLTLKARYKRSLGGKGGGDLRTMKLDALSKEVWPDMAPSASPSSPADEQSVVIVCSSASTDDISSFSSSSSSF